MDKIWIKSLLVASLLILAALGAIISLEPHQYYVKVPSSSYTLSGDYAIKENLIPNSLYNQSYLENPQAIYNGITSSINISAQVFINLNNMSERNVSIISEVTLISSSPSWEKVVNTTITHRNVSTKGSYVISIPINLSKELALADNIDIQLQDGNSVPALDFNLSVVAKGMSTFSASISIALHSTFELVTYNIPKPLSVAAYNQELINPHSLIGLNVTYGYIFFGGAGVVGIAMAILYIPRRDDFLDKIKKDHAEQIIEIDTPPVDSAKKLKKIEDILKISEIFETPIFLYVPDKVLYISHQGEQYKYEFI